MNKWIKKDSFYFVDCRLLFNNVEEQLKNIFRSFKPQTKLHQTSNQATPKLKPSYTKTQTKLNQKSYIS